MSELDEIKVQIRDKMRDETASVEDQLDFLDEMLAKAQAKSDEIAISKGQPTAPIDPADFTICDGCQ